MPETIVGPVALAFTNLLELEDMARTKIPRATFDYIAGGAEDEVTLRRNREAFGRWALRPRVLRDVSKRPKPRRLVRKSHGLTSVPAYTRIPASALKKK